MGIDFGFTDESKKESSYAQCRPYLRRRIGFHVDVGEGDDRWSAAREQYEVINVAALRDGNPQLYENVLAAIRRPELEHWYFNEPWLGELYHDRATRQGLKPYIEKRASTVVLLSKLDETARAQADSDIDAENEVTAWDRLSFEKRKELCSECPIRPDDEWTCYLRFSSYPGMNAFRAGFLLTLAYAESLDQERVNEAMFSFPYLNRSAGELPRDKIHALLDLCSDAEINKRSEQFANLVFGAISSTVSGEEKLEGGLVDLTYAPFVDEFTSEFIYRDETYSPAEARELLPYLETLKEVAEWAVWETDDGSRRKPIIVAHDRIESLVQGLRIADRYGLEMYVSY